MKILVTGAAGFIGSNLVAELLRRDHTVVGLDNLSQGSRLNLAEVADSTRRSTFREADIRDAAAMLAPPTGAMSSSTSPRTRSRATATPTRR